MAEKEYGTTHLHYYHRIPEAYYFFVVIMYDIYDNPSDVLLSTKFLVKPISKELENAYAIKQEETASVGSVAQTNLTVHQKNLNALKKSEVTYASSPGIGEGIGLKKRREEEESSEEDVKEKGGVSESERRKRICAWQIFHQEKIESGHVWMWGIGHNSIYSKLTDNPMEPGPILKLQV